MKMIAIECFALLIVLLLLLAPTAVDAGKKYRKFECSAKKSEFETYLYLDIKLKSKFKESQLKELELVVKSTYNDFIKKNYCDVYERQITDIDASFREKRNDTIHRYLLHIHGTCRDCASDSKIFSTKPRRLLQAENSLLKKTGKKSSSRICQCPMDVSFGTPSTPHYTPYVKEKIVQRLGSKLQISIQSYFSLSEIRPIQCGDESSFEASAQMLFTSDMPANRILRSDLDQIEIGWKKVYNELQQGICDAQFKRIEQVDATIKFLSRASHPRSLQVSGVKYVIVLNTAMRGKCRSCKGQTSLLKNDAIKTRVIEKSSSDLSNLCFCSEGSGSLRTSTFLTTSQFTKAFNQWLQEERKEGRIRDLTNVTKTVDLLDSEPISLPPSQFALPSTVPVLRTMPPTRKPVPPTAKPVAKTKSPTPMIIPPSTSPSHQSLEPSLAPTDLSCKPSGLVISEPVPSLCGSQESNVVLLFQTFEDCNAIGWDEAVFQSTIPEMTNFLGLYNGNSLSPEFTFSGLDVVTIKSLTISLDFYEINQWGLQDDIEDFFALKLTGDVEDTIRFGFFQINVTEVPRSGKTEQGSIDWAISSQPTVTLADSMVEIYQTHNISMVVPLSFFAANATIKVKVEWRLPGIINKFVGIDNFLLAACV